MIAGQAGCATRYQHLLLAEGIVSNDGERKDTVSENIHWWKGVCICVGMYVCVLTHSSVCMCLWALLTPYYSDSSVHIHWNTSATAMGSDDSNR